MAVMNASLAAMNMNIAAEALGVGSVMLSETGRSGLLDAGYLRGEAGAAGGRLPADDDRLRLPGAGLPAHAAAAAAGADLL